MENRNNLYLYNSLSRKKENFVPIKFPYVGMYVCGPTVYGDAHLGHARPAITFDLLYRYLLHLNYKVRYVRNITDVGHLENDADEGEDKIAKKAKLEELEPMEVVQYYTIRYHQNMDALNVKRPSIEPFASGHIIEQIEMIKKIIESGFAYESNGSIYFNVSKYNDETGKYGELSGRVLEDLLAQTRTLEGQTEKKNSADFAVWKKASPEHIMKWESPWGLGFPGWHMECSAMSTKYLGQQFDIHGGGMDLLFPHHECEIAQSRAANKKEPVKYWIHNNMITINGQKMGKSLGNFITLDEFFSGKHDLLHQVYSPMTIRFFLLQAHYRSTVDFSNEALQAAEKGYNRLMKAFELVEKIKESEESSVDFKPLYEKCFSAMNDDLNSPIALSFLFDMTKIINSIYNGKDTINKNDKLELLHFLHIFVYEILGLKNDSQTVENKNEVLDKVLSGILDLRHKVKLEKDYKMADLLRDTLKKSGISIKDTKEGSSWSLEE